MALSPEALRGFKAELEKRAQLDTDSGAQGAAIGAIVGALLGGITPHILAKMLTRNADMAALLGAMAGAGGLGAAGLILGQKAGEKK